MKKTALLFALFAIPFAVYLLSCQKENPLNQSPVSGQRGFVATDRDGGTDTPCGADAFCQVNFRMSIGIGTGVGTIYIYESQCGQPCPVNISSPVGYLNAGHPAQTLSFQCTKCYTLIATAFEGTSGANVFVTRPDGTIETVAVGDTQGECMVDTNNPGHGSRQVQVVCTATAGSQ